MNNTTFYLSIHQLMDIWIVSTLFGYYEQCYYECLCADFCVDVCFRFSHIYLGVKLNSFIFNYCFLNKVLLLLSL